MIAMRLNLMSLLAFLGMGACAVVFGLLATTANPILIGMGIGLICGPMLLAAPRVTIWLILVLGLVMGAFSSSHAFGKVSWLVSIMSMLLMLPALISPLAGGTRRLPGFIKLALVFMVYSLLTTLVHWYSFGEFIAGFKRYFQMYGLMLALTLLAFTPQDFRRWRKLLMAIALLQLPFAAYELLILVPQRGGLALSSYTTDVVAGTFGANLQGGSPSSVMVIYLFIALAFLMVRWRAGLMTSSRLVPLLLICLLPIGMGENKIAVVMLPLIGLVILRKDMLQSPARYLPAMALLGLLTAGLGYFYITVIMDSTLAKVMADTVRYNFGSQGYAQGEYLNRFTSITFWWAKQGLHDPVGFLLGNGLGSSYTSFNAMAGHLGLKYLHFGINLTAASTLLWDTGILGLLLFIAIFCSAWVAADRLYRGTPDPAIRADLLAIQAAIALFLLSLAYSDSIVNLLPMEIIYAVVLGYLGYLLQRHGPTKNMPGITDGQA